MPRPQSNRVRGLTLIEMLVVLGVVVLLIALLLPAVRTSNSPLAYRAQCQNNLKQILLALQNYKQEHQALPPAYTVDADGRPLHSWRTLILPYLGEGESLDKSIDLTKPWDDPANAEALQTPPSAFRCPASTRTLPGKTTYLAIVGPNAGLHPIEPRRLEEITDDHATTLLLMDAGAENAVPWMAPVDVDANDVESFAVRARNNHQGKTVLGFVNGTVRAVQELPTSTWRAITTTAGNESLTDDAW